MGVNALEVRRRVMLAQPHEAVASGAVASFRTDVVSPLPMEFDLVPIQSGTGDPSPDNIRPITAHDGFTRTGTGKNLWNFLKSGQDINPSGVDTTNKTIEIRAYDDRNKPITNGLKFKENTQYTIILKLYRSNGTTSGTSYGSNVGVEYTDGTKTGITFVSAGDSVFVTTVFTTNAAKNVKCISVSNNSGFSYIKYEESGIFEGVLTADDFETYNGTSIETTFPTPPGTVYGGHVRDNGDGTGTLTVDRVCYTAETTNVVSTASTGIKYAQIGIGQNSPALPESDLQNGTISSEYQFRKNAPTTTGWFRIAGGTTLFIFDERFTNLDTAKEILASENPQFVYELAEPQTYILSLTALQSLIGQNHIWVDNADEVSVEYWGH